MADDTDGAGSDERISFRVDAEKKARLEQLVKLYDALDDSPGKVSVSELMRESVDEIIDELEEDLEEKVASVEDILEGNPKTPKATAD